MDNPFIQGLIPSLYTSIIDRMNSSKEDDIVDEFPGMLRIHKDGRVERLLGTDFVPPTAPDPAAGVSSKDITISTNPHAVTARLYIPTITEHERHLKLPLIIYFPGGGFCIASPFTSRIHQYVQTIVSQAKVVAVSVNYRKAPENPIPAAYEDSWAAICWAFSHAGGAGPDDWLNRHADYGRVFLAGDSAGGNIVHNMAMAAGNSDSGRSIRFLGAALIHPYFWGVKPIGSEAANTEQNTSVNRLWPFICPTNPNNDDRRVNPVAKGASSLAGLGSSRILVIVAEKDPLRDRGWMYYEAVGQSGWPGVAEIMETEGEGHAFHFYTPESQKAKELFQRLATFFNMDMPS